jgi:hypothetical protein
LTGNVAAGLVSTGEPRVAKGAGGALLVPEEPVVTVGAPLVAVVSVGGRLVALAPLPAAGVAAGVVDPVLESGVTGNGLVPPAEPEPADGELVPLPMLGVGAAGVTTLLALGVPAGAVVALGPGGMDVGSGTGVPVNDGLPPETVVDDVLVGSAGTVFVGPIWGVDVTLAAGVRLGLVGIAVCEALAGTGVGVDGAGVGAGIGVSEGLTSVGVDAPRVVVAVVVAAGSVFVGGGVTTGAVLVGPGDEVGAPVIVAGGVPVGATDVPVDKAVDVAGTIVLVVAGREATGEADGAGFEGLAEAVVGEPMDGLGVATSPGCVMTTVGAGANVFVTAGDAGALDAVTTTLGVSVMSGVGAAPEELEILES